MSANVEVLLKRLQVLEDKDDIVNLLGRRAAYHSAGRHDLEIEELWSHRDDSALELEDWGVWVGYKRILQAYVTGMPFPPAQVGLMVEHLCCTPVLEIAGDGKTAKGTWISPGHETFPIPGSADPTPKAHWCWGRYAIDFIKEDGKWKIWHLHVLTTFRSPFSQDWVATGIKKPDYFPPDGVPPPTIGKPDLPPSFNEAYHPDRGAKMQPVPPEPYKSWSDTWSATELHELKKKWVNPVAPPPAGFE